MLARDWHSCPEISRFDIPMIDRLKLAAGLALISAKIAVRLYRRKFYVCITIKYYKMYNKIYFDASIITD